MSVDGTGRTRRGPRVGTPVIYQGSVHQEGIVRYRVCMFLARKLRTVAKCQFCGKSSHAWDFTWDNGEVSGVPGVGSESRQEDLVSDDGT